MKINEFSKLARARFDVCFQMMVGKKHLEYSRGNDKLHNFHTAARIQNTTPEVALWGMMIKQFVSIQDMVEDSRHARLPELYLLQEKISDVINYLVLLEAIVTEQIVDNE